MESDKKAKNIANITLGIADKAHSSGHHAFQGKQMSRARQEALSNYQQTQIREGLKDGIKKFNAFLANQTEKSTANIFFSEYLDYVKHLMNTDLSEVSNYFKVKQNELDDALPAR